ncbi:hypothetical protein [Hufsiella ginkgonis]|uniref:DUF4468 domain-containing protein n=1 Tax=Hufsiella ginkgonis TaxID=2695274 RepID=A0A7K1XZP2_9SPHI|nr:hypothetical protein [Hufsiella ginkgonis]MXV16443.1 hypothetical protein [Hufsiella ginkgonis]
MKKLIFFLPLFMAIHSFAQKDSIIRMPIKKGIVFYERSFPVNGTRDDAYKKALSWFKASFKGKDQGLQHAGKLSGRISGSTIFKLTTSESGNYFWVKPEIAILVRNDSCIFQAYNFYVNPIMPGVTHEYSEIEYRWWDYKNGKPWKRDDQLLFKGIDDYMNQLISGLHQEIK